MPATELSVVIPALNEAAILESTLGRVRRALPAASVIVADGGSTDDTARIAVQLGARVVSAPRGRGPQCRTGADQSTSPWLLFLHADTLLPLEAAAVIARFQEQPNAQVATFRHRFTDGGVLLNASAWLATRVDSVFTRFGDQGILIRRSFYAALGGFDVWPLFEDVALLQRARKSARIHWLPATVETSARRFRARGIVRQRLLNARLMVQYLAGVSPFKLAASYQHPPPTRHRKAD